MKPGSRARLRPKLWRRHSLGEFLVRRASDDSVTGGKKTYVMGRAKPAKQTQCHLGAALSPDPALQPQAALPIGRGPLRALGVMSALRTSVGNVKSETEAP
ncbi:hypothetical protein NDU88_006821 [Pleurodeles waltl]|uniref:Uncharacterized protein n=1 Tax=Pleurodeles waltl TaxID=8319 RepID=A0AAV7WEN6_PLEWA|nr:hypothetical protein NDU88_006821 [Pleurodeles waltl]